MSNQSPPKKITETSASEIRLHSAIDGPIKDMSFLKRSLLFAEISFIAYMHPKQCSEAASGIGFTKGKFINSDGAQAYWFSNKWDSVVVCRGTEPHEWNDVKADLYAVMALAETVGRVHRGFKKEVDDLWVHLEGELSVNELPIWFTGHSLGAAMAYICSGRCLLSHIRSDPEAVYTFGGPRIGNKRYVNYTDIEHFRWVNNNDIVTRVPPSWLGYRHSGTEKYIDRHGNVSNVQGWRRFKDRLRGFITGLGNWKIDQFADHSMTRYIDALHRSVRKEAERSD